MDLTDIKLLRAGIKTQLKKPNDLRDKQIDAFRAFISDKFSDEQLAHSYFKLPTGFGKTVMFSHMVRAYFDTVKSTGAKRNKIIIIVPRLSLINQTQDKLSKFADISATEYSGRRKDNHSDVVITTYDSLKNLFGVIDFNDVGLIFADEAHHMLGEQTSIKLIECNKYVPIIGFTATPEYENNHAVANLLSTEIYSMNIRDAISAGVLSPVKNVLYHSSVVLDLSTISARNNGEYDYDKITAKINPNTLATEIARIYAYGADADTGIEFKNLRAIINCPNVAIAKKQADQINKIIGRDVAIALHKVDTSDKDFEKQQQDFINGKYSVACQVGTMTEGFDDVTVSLCINYPTRSRVKAEQTAGRAIRIDAAAPDKIAFVIDTIFRATPDEATSDIIYNAKNSGQVLFADIAGGMVLYPRDFQPRNINRTQQDGTRREVEFVDFELITNQTTLLELKRSADTRIANETIGEKTDDWQSAADLAQDPTFPNNSHQTIKKYLEKFQPAMPEFIQIRTSKNNTSSLCLHRGGREKFCQMAGLGNIPPKTDEWLSPYELAKDADFPVATPKTILQKLQELQPEMPDMIQPRKSFSKSCLCLLKSGCEKFCQLAGWTENIPLKTDEWQSAVDLINDATFPRTSFTIINQKLQELQPLMPEFIQKRKSGSVTPLCLHRDGREKFCQMAGWESIPPKTDEWQSARDLRKDRTFPITQDTIILRYLEQFQPQMPEFIQKRKSGPKTPLCLHRDGREKFLELIERDKQKSMTRATRVVSAGNTAKNTANTVTATGTKRNSHKK